MPTGRRTCRSRPRTTQGRYKRRTTKKRTGSNGIAEVKNSFKKAVEVSKPLFGFLGNTFKMIGALKKNQNLKKYIDGKKQNQQMRA